MTHRVGSLRISVLVAMRQHSTLFTLKKKIIANTITSSFQTYTFHLDPKKKRKSTTYISLYPLHATTSCQQKSALQTKPASRNSIYSPLPATPITFSLALRNNTSQQYVLRYFSSRNTTTTNSDTRKGRKRKSRVRERDVSMAREHRTFGNQRGEFKTEQCTYATEISAALEGRHARTHNNNPCGQRKGTFTK